MSPSARKASFANSNTGQACSKDDDNNDDCGVQVANATSVNEATSAKRMSRDGAQRRRTTPQLPMSVCPPTLRLEEAGQVLSHPTPTHPPHPIPHPPHTSPTFDPHPPPSVLRPGSESAQTPR